MGICLLLVMPQMLYWHYKTGMYIYDSYKNPGVGLDYLSPHIINVLFSYRKGWLLYTPVMIFSLIGFYFLYKKIGRFFMPVLFISLFRFTLLLVGLSGGMVHPIR